VVLSRFGVFKRGEFKSTTYYVCKQVVSRSSYKQIDKTNAKHLFYVISLGFYGVIALLVFFSEGNSKALKIIFVSRSCRGAFTTKSTKKMQNSLNFKLRCWAGGGGGGGGGGQKTKKKMA
jgi:hypothetical protein